MIRVVKVAALAGAALLLSGCAVTAPSQSSGSPAGTWGVMADGETYLMLDADGSLGGHDGCNGFGGSWTQADDASPVVFEDVMMTLMACPGGDQWLTSGRSALVDGDTLVVLGDDGEVVGILPRSS